MIGEKTKIWQASLRVEHDEERLAAMVCLASRLKIHLPLPPSPTSFSSAGTIGVRPAGRSTMTKSALMVFGPRTRNVWYGQ